MQHYWLTLYLWVALTLCMLSHDDIIQRGHRKRQVKYICTRSAHFFCFPQLTFQRMLISYKVPVRMYNIEPGKISRIMYLIMFWSVTNCSSNGKWAIAWENLSFGNGFTEEASGSIIRMRGSRGSDPTWKFTNSILTFAPTPGKIWTPSPVKCWTPSGTLKKYSFP